MPLIDHQGRIGGRVNVLDAAVLGFVLLLIPVAYGVFLLFRPSTPHIESVTRSEITREERRLAGGSLLSAKLKVRGSGLNPMLRATIGDTAALGFVFESPNSADVLVGRIAPGNHDLVLFDGVQEVARAKDAVTIEMPSLMRVRLAGRLLDLDPAVAERLEATAVTALEAADMTLVALGPIEPARERLQINGRAADVLLEGRVERNAVVNVQCDPRPAGEPCTIGGAPLIGPGPAVVSLAAPQASLKLAVEDVLPSTPARAAQVRVRLVGGAELQGVRPGDRDALLDERAAVVSELGPRTSAGGSIVAGVTIRLGVDASREGWRYRGRLVTPGASFTFSNSDYVISGTVEALTLLDESRHPR